MKSIAYLGICCFFGLFMACENNKPVVVEDYEICLGETKSFDDGEFDITFAELLEDSRCPPEAVCFWEGRAHVKLLFTKSEIGTDIELVTENSINKDSMSMTVYDNYQVEFVAAAPFPIDMESYCITLSLIEL